MIFSLRDISKKYRNKEILFIKSLDIKKGEICCITGPNGAGKTTLLEIMAGILTPDSGSIMYKDKKEPARGFKEINMILQDTIVFNTTVYKNIEFGLKANKINKKLHKSKIQNALLSVNLEKQKNQRAVTLSGGEKKQLAIARALALEPEVLILDEPIAGLDRNNRNKIISILKKIHKNNDMTMIIASHDMDFVLSVTTQTYSLFGGRQVPLSIENVFHGKVIDNHKVQVNQVELYITGDKTGEINVVIPPENIVLSEEPLSSSMRNRFQGKVVKLEKDHDRIKVWVDIGIVLCSYITPVSLKKMKITVEDSIWVEFKANSIKCY